MPSPKKPPPLASVSQLPFPQELTDLSETQVNELIELERSLTLYQMNLLMKAFLHLEGQLPLWGDPKRDQWIKEKKILMYFTPLIWDDETLMELAQLKQLEKLSLLRLPPPGETHRQYWQLTARGYLMVQWYQETISVYPALKTNP
jgi:hypothetical protein